MEATKKEEGIRMADNEQARRSALVCAYFLSRLDRRGIARLDSSLGGKKQIEE